MPVEASAQSVPIDWLWNLGIGDDFISVCADCCSIDLQPGGVPAQKRRYNRCDAYGGEYQSGDRVDRRSLFIVMAFAYLGAGNLAEIQRVDPDAMVVKVTGQQWSWRFEYPAYGVTSTELHLPVDQQVLLQMTSRGCDSFLLGA